MTFVIGYPLLYDHEIIDLGYTYSDNKIEHVHTRDIPQLLVELGLFTSKRLARGGTPPHMNRVYGERELDILEWKRRNPWPCVFTFVVGAATQELRDDMLMDIGYSECKDKQE